jgi:ATP-dependent protease Clp ATPase subunit
MKTECSFCGAADANGRRIIAGPSVWICEQCIATAWAALDGWPPGESRGLYGNPPTSVRRCSFCGQPRSEASGFVAAGAYAICGECVVLTRELLAEFANDA